MKLKILSAILCIAVLSCDNSKNKKTPPNILFIVADDLGYEKLGCYGGLETNTPNLDQMAEQGVLFTRAYTSPVCTPSRMSIYTGNYTTTHRYTTVLPVHLGTKEYVDFNKWTTYAQILQKNGYLTAVTGKWQLAALEFHPEHVKSAGFDTWCVWQIWKDGAKTKRYWTPTINQDGEVRSDIDSLFGSNVLTDYVIETMKTAKKQNKPFCIQHNMFLPHVPITETPTDRELGREASLDNMIEYLDGEVGKLVKAVNELGLQDNTLILFAGDNGTDLKETRKTDKGIVTGGKRVLSDGGTHVPLIAYWPAKIGTGRKVDDLVDFADFFPTLCEVAGVEIDVNTKYDGISFYQPLMGTGEGQREWITAGIYDDFIIFDGEWRFQYPDNQLIDCRELPNENPADMDSEEAKKAMKKLKPILEKMCASN